MAKKLIVLSDGTGNSAARLFKTNVWKLYEALDTFARAEPRESTIRPAKRAVGAES